MATNTGNVNIIALALVASCHLSPQNIRAIAPPQHSPEKTDTNSLMTETPSGMPAIIRNISP